MKKLTHMLAPLMLSVTFGVQADTVGGSIEASYWYAGVSGEAVSGDDKVDMESDLGFENDSFFEIAATLEHPVPALPNIRVKYADLDQTEDGSFTGTFEGAAYTGAVETNLDLSHMDLILYYEILDNYVSVDVGLDIKKFDGQFNIADKDNPSEVSNTKIDEVLPLLYVSAEVELPLTNLFLGAELSGVSYSGNRLTDSKIRLRQGFGLVFLELGYRQMSLKVDDLSNVDVDVDFDGAYLSTGLDF